ncbi:MAG: maleylpyruvate isomerase N-terminal domain-containing protein [Mycobacterium sp.]
MNGTDYVGLVDTDRAELRERIGATQERFDRLVRAADPDARVPHSEWTVQQTVAHVLTVAHRYREIAQGRDYRRARHPRELDTINLGEFEAVIAPIPELADQLQALAPEMDAFFDALVDRAGTFPFHHTTADSVTAQTNWLGELLFHGHDVARAVKSRWELPERDMALVLRGALQLGPAWLRRDTGAATDLCVAFEVHGARPYLIDIRGGRADIRERRAEDRPDAVLRGPASVFTQLLYQRTGPLAAALRGLRIVGGRRPWLALRLQSCFERP